MDSDKKNHNKIVFTKEIDSRIAGIALVVSFLICGIFLIYFPDYFSNTKAGEIFRWIFIVIGILGALSEVSKARKQSRIKGTDDVLVGILVLGIFMTSFFFEYNSIVKGVLFLFFLIGVFGITKGIVEIYYSLSLFRNDENNHTKNDILGIISKAVALILTILQVVKIVSEIKF